MRSTGIVVLSTLLGQEARYIILYMKGKDIDTKIDELAQMVAGGFSEVHEDMQHFESRIGSRIETIEKTYTTKDDLVRLRGDIDIMLDRHIGTFRKDYDDLAMRVKKLEQLVLER